MSLLVEQSFEELVELAERLDGRPVPGVRMSEKQFVDWCTDEIRAEWVDGEVIVMAPASDSHSELNGWLLRLVGEFVEHHNLGAVRGPELQVRFAARRRRRCPDVMFISETRRRLIRPTFVNGAPDLIIEVVSAESEARDWRDKYLDYEAAGVREYWIVDRPSERVEAYALDRSKHYRQLPGEDGKIKSKVLRGLYVRPEWLWKSPLPRLATIAKELKLR